MPYVLRNRPDLDTRNERRYGWIFFLILLLGIGAFLMSALILSD